MEMLRAKYAIAIWAVLGIGWAGTSISSLHAAPQKEADKGQEKKELVETDKTLMNESPFDLIYVKKEAGVKSFESYRSTSLTEPFQRLLTQQESSSFRWFNILTASTRFVGRTSILFLMAVPRLFCLKSKSWPMPKI